MPPPKLHRKKGPSSSRKIPAPIAKKLASIRTPWTSIVRDMALVMLVIWLCVSVVRYIQHPKIEFIPPLSVDPKAPYSASFRLKNLSAFSVYTIEPVCSLPEYDARAKDGRRVRRPRSSIQDPIESIPSGEDIAFACNFSFESESPTGSMTIALDVDYSLEFLRWWTRQDRFRFKSVEKDGVWVWEGGRI